MRLGLFGGSFDPPHLAHLAIAQAVKDRFALDRVLLAPAALQPLKRAGAHAPFPDRLRMVELLCHDHPGIEASDVDAPRPDGAPNYTIDTLHRLRAQLPPATEIFLITGADTFLTLPQWKSAAALLHEAQWIVVSRPGTDLTPLNNPTTPTNPIRINNLLPANKLFIPTNPTPSGILATLNNLTPEQRAHIHLFPDLTLPISATEVRTRLQTHLPTTGLLPPAIEHYIQTHHLYTA